MLRCKGYHTCTFRHQVGLVDENVFCAKVVSAMLIAPCARGKEVGGQAASRCPRPGNRGENAPRLWVCEIKFNRECMLMLSWARCRTTFKERANGINLLD